MYKKTNEIYKMKHFCTAPKPKTFSLEDRGFPMGTDGDVPVALWHLGRGGPAEDDLAVLPQQQGVVEPDRNLRGT